MNKEKILSNRYEHKRKQYNHILSQYKAFMDKTYNLLLLLGLSDEDIKNYYERGYKWQLNKQ